MISVLIAATHRFGRVRRNGYDPDEVDAVVARLISELRRHDERVVTLTERLDAADASADAIRRTFVAAEATRDEIMAKANADASMIVKDAKIQAEELVGLAEALEAQIAVRRDRALVEVYAETDHTLRLIEAETARRSAETEWVVREAVDAANREAAEVGGLAEVKMREEFRRAGDLSLRVASIREAVLSLEQAAAKLAESALQDARVLDLTAIEQIDRLTLDLTEPQAEKPLLVLAEPADVVESPDESPRTRYQRLTGIPLRERIKIARMSE